jgi:hypothetical protein
MRENEKTSSSSHCAREMRDPMASALKFCLDHIEVESRAHQKLQKGAGGATASIQTSKRHAAG